MRALARVEARCLLRHPVFLVGVLLTAVIVVPSAGSDGQSKLFVLLGGGVLPLAAGTFIAANLAALRSRRDGTDELFGALPRRGISRTAAQLLAVAVVAPVALILLGAMFVALGAPGGLVVGFDGMRHAGGGGARTGAAAGRLPRRRRDRARAPGALRGGRAARARRPAGARGAGDRVAGPRQPALAGSARPRHDRRARRVGSVRAGGLAAGLRPRARLRPRGDAAAPALSRLPDRSGRRGRPAPLEPPGPAAGRRRCSWADAPRAAAGALRRMRHRGGGRGVGARQHRRRPGAPRPAVRRRRALRRRGGRCRGSCGEHDRRRAAAVALPPSAAPGHRRRRAGARVGNRAATRRHRRTVDRRAHAPIAGACRRHVGARRHPAPRRRCGGTRSRAGLPGRPPRTARVDVRLEPGLRRGAPAVARAAGRRRRRLLASRDPARRRP